MGLLLKLAVRNLLRNTRRTLITSSAIAFGLALLVFSSGFADGAHGQMIEAGIKATAGEVVVQGRGWQQKREVDIVVPDTAAVAAHLRATAPKDAVVVERVFFQGLLTAPHGSSGVALVGVQPGPEAQVNDIDDKLVAGTYLDDAPDGIVLGKTLAKTLGVSVGDKVVLMTQRGGEIESRLFHVKGIFSVGIDEIDGFFAHVPLATAQKLLALDGDVTQLSVHTRSYHDASALTARVKTALAGRDVEVLSWDRALPQLAEWVRYDNAGLYILLIVIAVIVAMGITNTVLMSVLERLPELGVMLALGFTPKKLAALVVYEASLLGVGGVLLGTALGVGANALASIHGLDFSKLAGGQAMEAGGVPLDLHIYPDLSPEKVIAFAAIGVVVTVASAAWPAVKAARLKPIECLETR